MEVHQKEKRHSCIYCDKSFFKMSSKKRHELTHVQHDTWKCNACLKTFKDRSSLRYHVSKKVCHSKKERLLDVIPKTADRNADRIMLKKGEKIISNTILGI